MKRIQRTLSSVIAICVMTFSGFTFAANEDFLRPKPTARWTIDSNKCAAQFKRMEKILGYWASGKAIATDVHDRPDQNYWAGGLPFWAYKNQAITMRESFGDLYFFGCAKAGRLPDKQAAFAMYERSAVNHSPSAQFKLGKMLRDGDGVPKNEDAGLAWISSAALEGSIDASSYLTQNGIDAPQPIWPNSYALAAMEAKAVFDGKRSAERAEIVRDLGNLAIGATAAYLTFRAEALRTGVTTPAKKMPKTSYSSPPLTFRPIIMKRPVYCHYQGNIRNPSGGNTAYFYVTKFCN